jgi:predicted metal-dependent hydrolase
MAPGAAHEFKARRVAFDYAETPSSFIPGDPHTSHVVNVLHLLLPAGERWFCDVYRAALPHITDEALRRDVKAFIGQEATHSRAHSVVLDHLDSIGVDTRPFTRLVEWAFGVVKVRTGWSWLPERLRRWIAKRYLIAQLSGIAAVEHYTSVLGWWFLVQQGLDDAGADPEMMALVRWHAAEEVEHRSVAFDAYQAVVGGRGYVRRCIGMAGVFVGIFATWIVGTWFLLRRDPTVVKGRRASLVRFVRAGRAGRMPTVSDLLRATIRYFAPRFHPSHEGRTEVAVAYLSSAPGVAAAA